MALLSPQTPCANTGPDGGTVADETQCSPTQVPNLPANPTQQQLYGSGLPVDVPTECADLNALPAGFDAGAGGGASPDYECLPTKPGP